MTKRYSVRQSFDGHPSTVGIAGGRYAKLEQARKEAARLTERAWWRVNSPADLLGKGSFRYAYGVWDHWNRRWA